MPQICGVRTVHARLTPTKPNKNLLGHSDIFELITSLLIRWIQMWEMSKLGWLIGLVKHALCPGSLYFLHLLLLSISKLLSSSQPPLWSVGKSSWLQIQRSEFDSRRYHILWEVVVWNGVNSLMSTTEKLLGKKKVAAPVYKAENTAVGIRHADHVAPSICKSWH
jgi:hypothetical protein